MDRPERRPPDWSVSCTSLPELMTRPNLPKLGKDIDEEYDRLFGDLLDEFAHDSFGINLKRRK